MGNALVRTMTLVACSLMVAPVVMADEPLLVVDSVVLATMDEAEVPAEEAGVLRELAVSAGAHVARGDTLGRLDEREAQLVLDRAKIELENARRQAKNDIDIRVMSKAADVAGAELKRAIDSRERYEKSVSETELDHLRLAEEHARLQIEQAEHDRETARLAVQLAEKQVQLAELALQKRMLRAPISGTVVQILRQQGEWVQPGQLVVRIVGTERLKAIGFLDGRHAREDITGRSVDLQISGEGYGQEEYRGIIAFMHPEVNPVNQQIDFWAEIDNRDQRLRPGLKGRLVILPEDAR